MEFLKILLVIVEVITCLLLIGVILLQRSKNEGMGGLAAGSGMGEQLFGSRTGNVLTRTTIILACVFMATTTFLAILYSRSGDKQSIIEQQLQQQAGAGAMPAPAAPAAPAPAAAPAAAPVPVTLPAPGGGAAAPAAPVAAPAAP